MQQQQQQLKQRQLFQQQLQQQQQQSLKAGSPQLVSSPQLMQAPSPQISQQMSPQPDQTFAALQMPKVPFEFAFDHIALQGLSVVFAVQI
jgi:hypothetical protein